MKTVKYDMTIGFNLILREEKFNIQSKIFCAQNV